MDRRYQVFISSTFIDLEEERRMVMEAIIECNCFPAGMEMFPAIDMEQFEYIKSIIKESDYYILIIAGRYGTLANDGISYTEKEYDYAVKIGIPVLAFLKKEIETIPANKTDGDLKIKKKLLDFREKVGKNRLLQTWDTPYELKAKITLSLTQAFKIIPRIGWIRGNIVKSDASPMDITEKHKIEFWCSDLYQNVVFQYSKAAAIAGVKNYKHSMPLYNILKITGQDLIKGVSKEVFGNKILQALVKPSQSYKVSNESVDQILEIMRIEKIIADKGKQDLVIFTARSRNAYLDNIAD